MIYLPLNDPEPIDFRSRPLIGAAARRRVSRAAVFAIGVLIGLLLARLA